LRVRGLEGVVVPLDPRPDDHVRAGLRGEVDRLPGQAQRLVAERVVGRAERPLSEAWIQVQTGRDAVDPMTVEGLPNLVQVVRRELPRVVELVVVHEVAESLHRGPYLGHGRGPGQLGLVPAGVEAGGHAAEGPDTEARLHDASVLRCAT